MIKIINVKSLVSALTDLVEKCKSVNDEEINIIVPDKLSLYMERFLFENMGISASFNFKINTLNRFAKRNCDFDENLLISKESSILLIHKILNSNAGQLKTLKSNYYSFSYSEEIFNTIGQLKASKISYEEMKKFASSDEQLQNKIYDLAFVYEQYELSKAGKIDATDSFVMSAFSISDGLENAKIFLVGFDDFTAIEYSLIEQLAKDNELIVYNYYTDGDNKYLYNSEVFSQLKNIAYLCEVNLIVENAYNIKDKENIQKFLENNVFSLKNTNFLQNYNEIQIFLGKNVREELEFVARKIRENILNGKSYSSFGVAVYELEKFENIAEEVFDKYDINFYIDNKMSINKSILYKFLNSVFKYNLENYNLCHLIDIINSPFFELDNEEKRKLIALIRRVNFKGFFTKFNVVNNEFNESCEKLKNFIKNFEFVNMSIQEIIEKIDNLFSSFNFETIIEKISLNGKLNNRILLTKSKQVILDLMQDILKFYTDISLTQFVDIFIHIASIVKINNLPLTLDAVKIVDANDNMEIFDNLFIVNCTNQTAPQLKYDCGVILDSEIDKLNFSHKLAPTIAHINHLNKFRLFNSVLMFNNSLTISYSSNASELIKDLQKRIQTKINNNVYLLKPITSFSFGNYVALSEKDLIEYQSKNSLKFQKSDDKIVKNKQFYQLNKENLKIFYNLNTVSASLLESYFKCPFFSFLTNILKINPELNNELLSFDIGNILHKIIYKYYKINKQVEDVYSFCKHEVFNYLENDERLKLTYDSPTVQIVVDEAIRIINGLNYIDKNSSFVPSNFEFAFGGETALNLGNISIKGQIDRVDSCGNMLRIVDYKSGRAEANLKELYYGNKLQLFLYALAMENLKHKKVVGSFYLPVHNAYVKELGNSYSLKGFYINEEFVIKAFDKRLIPGLKSDIVNAKMTQTGKAYNYGDKQLSEQDFSLLKEYSKKVSNLAVKEIKQGYIEPTPTAVSSPCEYCAYSHICMKRSKNILERGDNTVTLESFKENA